MLTKILIADSNEEFSLALAGELQADCMVQTCGDGLRALELLRSFQPDLLVLDVMLPGLDGLTLLQTAKEEGICPPVLVASSFLGSYVTAALQQYNVVYIVIKPCLVSAVASRINDLIGQLTPRLFSRPSSQSLVSSALLELGICTSRGGYHYCCEAILMLAQTPSLQVTKSIYPEIAKAHACQAASVEKAIRDTIAAAWDNRNDSVWRRYFPAAPNGQIPRPSNRVFLTTVAEVVFCVNAGARA